MFDAKFFPSSVPSYYGMTPADQYLYMLQRAQQQIQAGVQAQYASTGYPINWLNGGAHTAAVLAAIGGGAVSAGGGGIYGGLQVLLQYAFAAGAYYEYQRRIAYPDCW